MEFLPHSHTLEDEEILFNLLMGWLYMCGQMGSPLQSFGTSPTLPPIPIDQIKAKPI